MPQLAQELIDAIIEEVQESSLAACSLTATVFVTSSQRRLFRWMSLSTVAAYERTAQLLASSPHLWQYFRYLALDVSDLPPHYPLLKAILAPLAEIERLSLKGHGLEQNPCLIDLISLPSIRCFGLEAFSVPSSLISLVLSSSFEQVFFSRLLITKDKDEQSERLSAPTDLCKFTIVTDHYKSMLHAMLHPKQARFLRRLKHLFIVSPGLTDLLLPADVPEFMKLLVACSSTLEHLAFELGKEPLPLPALPALRVLELWTYVASTDTPEMLHVIIAGMIASVPHLEVLKIAFLDPFGLSQGRPPRHHWMGHRPWAWADLDSTLVNMPHLRDVHVSLRYVWLPEPERYAAFVPFMQSHLPRAFDGGLISFSYGSNALHPMDSFALKD